MAGHPRTWNPRARSMLVPAVIAGMALVVIAIAGAAIVGASGGHPDATSRGTAGPDANAVPQTAAATAIPPLKGMVVGIDPGHNGRNYTDPSYLGRMVWNGREWEDCDTTGASTDSGYTEARFNFQVAGYLRADLIRAGARVVLTRHSNNGIGPCVTTRSHIIDNAHANAAVDIHADGGPVNGRGFAILEPIADGPNNAVIASSARLGADVRSAMLTETKMPISSYDGKNGITPRDDLAGLNLTTVPKILIEVGNMRNATDAKMLTSTAFQQQVARVLLAAIVKFLT
ncbi:MAG TPA: N-acetylmuramoyl-L-alanine amidase [Trebonia sp.]